MEKQNSTRAFGGEDTDGVTIDFDDDSDPIVGDLLDLEDQEVQHDQLPDAEECKADLPSIQKTRCSSKTWKTCGILSVGTILLAGFATAVVNRANFVERAYAPEERTEEIIQFLFKNKITPLPLLEEAGSAQRRAALFLAHGDAYHMELTSGNTARFVERYALATIWYHFRGQEWNYPLYFMSATDICEWHTSFYTASGNTINEGVMCDEKNGYVTKLILRECCCCC
jgi:hypothetical protein